MSAPEKAESALVSAVRSTVSVASSMDLVVSGQSAAHRINELQRITDPDGAASVTDLLKAVKLATTSYKAKVDTIGHPLKQAQDALRASTKPVLDALAAAEARGKNLLLAWRESERQRIDAERRAQEEAARKADAESAGEDAPPSAVEYVPDAENKVRGSFGASHGTKVLIVEAVNLHDIATFDPSLLTLNAAGARDAVRERIKNGGADEPGIGRDRSITFNGIRAWYEERIAVR